MLPQSLQRPNVLKAVKGIFGLAVTETLLAVLILGLTIACKIVGNSSEQYFNKENYYYR